MRPLPIFIVLSLAVSVASAQILRVDTLAGTTDGGGYVDAHGTAARFSDPTGVAIDSSGNVFVIDGANQVIRKVTPSGDVSTFAGTPGFAGNADGKPGRFRFPLGIALNKSTNDIYVADSYNYSIRKVAPDGTVSTVAGGVPGHTDGAGSAARFGFPVALDVLPDGTLYVADQLSDGIRKITPAGVVSTLAAVDTPESVAVDPLSGNVYAGSPAAGGIVKIAPDGGTSILAGGFSRPDGLAVDAGGNVIATDLYGLVVKQISPSGAVTTLAGKEGDFSPLYADGNGANARFFFPRGVAVDGSGNIFVADENNRAIRRIAPSRDVTTLAGDAPKSGTADGTGTAARFTSPSPCALGVDAGGNTWVADSTKVVKRITAAGVVTTVAGLAGTSGSQDGTGSAARFKDIRGLAIDPRDGSVVVSDGGNETIRRVTRDGVVTTVAGQAGLPGSIDGTGTAAKFNEPYGVAVDAGGNIFVADNANSSIRKITPAGVVTTFLAANPVNFLAPSYPVSVAVDAAGNVYWSEAFSSNRIKKSTPDGKIVVLAGSSGDGYADATGTAARFSTPYSIALDRDGNLYVADTGNDLIRRVTPAGVVTTVAGTWWRPGNVNGPGSAARFASPISVAVTPDGRVVIGDSDNHAVRVGTIVPTVRGRAAEH